MACSNFCSRKDLEDLEARIGYVSRAEERSQYRAIQKAQRMHEVAMEAATAGADVSGSTIEQKMHQIAMETATTGPDVCEGTIETNLFAAVLAGIVAAKGVTVWATELAAAISTTWSARKASRM